MVLVGRLSAVCNDTNLKVYDMPREDHVPFSDNALLGRGEEFHFLRFIHFLQDHFLRYLPPKNMPKTSRFSCRSISIDMG
jgi:hypothetical protein